MINNKCFFFIIYFFTYCISIGQTPVYYQSINFSLTGDSLKEELSNLILTTHNSLIEYTSSNSIDTWDVIKQSDLYLMDTTKVLLVYGYDDNDQAFENDRTRDKSLSCHAGPCDGLWNREHVFPKSLATPSLSTNFPGPGTDVHNLRACDYVSNSWRGNLKYGFGTGNSGVNTNGFWYPGDEWRGDVARIIMYMYLRYPTQCKPLAVGDGLANHSNFGDMPNIFLEWNQQDPVDQYEINRNNQIFINQGNRNPFIDNPYLATVIWNGPVAENPWGPLGEEYDRTDKKILVYPNPANDILYIESSNKINEVLVEVYDVFSNHLTSIKSFEINMEKYNPGIYILKIKLGETINVIKIIKE